MVTDKAFWVGHVTAIEREAISANAYAKREGVSLSAIYYWQRKLRNAAAEVSAPAHTFVQLRVDENGSAGSQAAVPKRSDSGSSMYGSRICMLSGHRRLRQKPWSALAPSIASRNISAASRRKNGGASARRRPYRCLMT